jgi:hypothetical protein
VSGEFQRLEDLCDVTVEQAEADTEVVRVPPFAGVVSRAHRLAPDRIAADAVPAAAAIAQSPVQRRVDSTQDDARWLSPFVQDARDQAELDVHGYLAAGFVPPLPAPAPAPRRWLPIVIGVGAAALAAAVVLALVTPQVSTLLRGDDAPQPSQAADAHDGGNAEQHEVEHVVGEDTRRRNRRDAPTPRPQTLQEPPPPPPPPAPRGPSSTQTTLAERLERLDAEAERQLAEGDLAGADRTLGRLVGIGGGHRLVELAYGDRFTIAHRQRDRQRQTALWREYLRRFPHGRLADDARAGMCRHAAPRARQQCWTSYLEDFPQGAYVAQAEAALDSAQADEP